MGVVKATYTRNRLQLIRFETLSGAGPSLTLAIANAIKTVHQLWGENITVLLRTQIPTCLLALLC